MITTFSGRHWFLSSFAEIACPVPVPWADGTVAPTREHAFQAAKAADWAQARWVLESPAPAEARRRGRQVRAWTDWDQVRREVMLDLILRQLRHEQPFRVMLAGTAGEVLVEGSTWGDVYWGAIGVANAMTAPAGVGPPPLWKPDERDPATWLCGHNWLGRVLMSARDVIT